MAGVADAVAAAKLWLVSAGAADLPYLSEGLYALVTVESEAVPTIAADERWRLYVNPSWVWSVSIEDLAREIAHQVWHLLLDHAGRAQALRVDSVTAAAWGDAADLGVVDALGSEGIVPDRLSDAAMQLRARRPGLNLGRSAEEFFAELSSGSGFSTGEEGEREASGGDIEPEIESDADGVRSGGDDGSSESADEESRDAVTGERGGEGSASDGRARPWELPAEADIGGLTEESAGVVRKAVAIAYDASARGKWGSEPGEVGRWLRRMLEPRIPWQHLLAQATRRGVGWTAGRTHTTYTRPSRRAASVPGVALPGWRRQNPTVACVVDTSGSVDDQLLGRAMGEVEGALRALGVGASDLTVLACDAAVQAVSRVRKASDAVLTGGGGTDLRVALAAVETLRPRPTLTVVFTDGFTPWPDQPPLGCAVVIALLLREGQDAPPTPSWATAIECHLD